MRIALILIFITFFAWNTNTQVKSFYSPTPKVDQGGTVVFVINPNYRVSGSCILFFGKQYVPNKNGYAIVGIPSDISPAKYQATMVECGRGVRVSSDYEEIEVLEFNFPETRIAANSGQPNPRSGKEMNAIGRAFSQTNMSVYDLTEGKQYLDPLDAARDIIDPFGPIYKNNSHLFHTGVDLRIKNGVPIKAVNNGLVVLAGKRFRREGNILIINHGLGIFSVYMHLSKFNIKEGDMVRRGDIIGLSGKSGRGIREPHLHFNIRIRDIYVDPLKFIDTVNQYVK